MTAARGSANAAAKATKSGRSSHDGGWADGGGGPNGSLQDEVAPRHVNTVNSAKAHGHEPRGRAPPPRWQVTGWEEEKDERQKAQCAHRNSVAEPRERPARRQGSRVGQEGMHRIGQGERGQAHDQPRDQEQPADRVLRSPRHEHDRDRRNRSAHHGIEDVREAPVLGGGSRGQGGMAVDEHQHEGADYERDGEGPDGPGQPGSGPRLHLAFDCPRPAAKKKGCNRDPMKGAGLPWDES